MIQLPWGRRHPATPHPDSSERLEILSGELTSLAGRISDAVETLLEQERHREQTPGADRRRPPS